jgi:hypothetical protein
MGVHIVFESKDCSFGMPPHAEPTRKAPAQAECSPYLRRGSRVNLSKLCAVKVFESSNSVIAKILSSKTRTQSARLSYA